MLKVRSKTDVGSGIALDDETDNDNHQEEYHEESAEVVTIDVTTDKLMKSFHVHIYEKGAQKVCMLEELVFDSFPIVALTLDLILGCLAF